MAKALATQAGLNFIAVKGPEVKSTTKDKFKNRKKKSGTMQQVSVFLFMQK